MNLIAKVTLKNKVSDESGETHFVQITLGRPLVIHVDEPVISIEVREGFLHNDQPILIERDD